MNGFMHQSGIFWYGNNFYITKHLNQSWIWKQIHTCSALLHGLYQFNYSNTNQKTVRGKVKIVSVKVQKAHKTKQNTKTQKGQVNRWRGWNSPARLFGAEAAALGNAASVAENIFSINYETPKSPLSEDQPRLRWTPSLCTCGWVSERSASSEVGPLPVHLNWGLISSKPPFQSLMGDEPWGPTEGPVLLRLRPRSHSSVRAGQLLSSTCFSLKSPISHSFCLCHLRLVFSQAWVIRAANVMENMVDDI